MTDQPIEAPARQGQRLVAFYDKEPSGSSDHRGVDLLPITDAALYQLPGPVLVKTVYVTHPTNERKLVVFADYDEQLARDKLNEALRIVHTLGATRIVAQAMKGVQTKGQAGASIRRAPLGGGVKGEKNAVWDVAYESEGAGSPPEDPRPLRYPDEPGFEAACLAVLRNGHRHVKIEIVRQSQFSIDGEVAAQLKRVGFSLGASGERNRTSLFVIDATFGPIADPIVTQTPTVTPALPPTSPRRSRFGGHRGTN